MMLSIKLILTLRQSKQEGIGGGVMMFKAD